MLEIRYILNEFEGLGLRDTRVLVYVPRYHAIPFKARYLWTQIGSPGDSYIFFFPSFDVYLYR